LEIGAFVGVDEEDSSNRVRELREAHLSFTRDSHMHPEPHNDLQNREQLPKAQRSGTF
jgi:hypothetical protein